MKKNNSAFTLIELMVVIAIIGIIAILSTNINFNKSSTIEKRDHLIDKIISIIEAEIVNVTTGKGIKVGTDIVNPTNIKISLSTGSIVSNYYSGNTIIGTGEIFKEPFYGDNLYNIKGFTYESKTGTIASIITQPFYIILNDSNISFSGSDVQLDSAIKISISAGYKEDIKKIILDKRSGTINIE